MNRPARTIAMYGSCFTSYVTIVTAASWCAITLSLTIIARATKGGAIQAVAIAAVVMAIATTVPGFVGSRTVTPTVATRAAAVAAAPIVRFGLGLLYK